MNEWIDAHVDDQPWSDDEGDQPSFNDDDHRVPYVWSWMRHDRDNVYDHGPSLNNLDWSNVKMNLHNHHDHQFVVETTIPIRTVHQGTNRPGRLTKSDVPTACLSDLMVALSQKSIIHWFRADAHQAHDGQYDDGRYLSFYDEHDMEHQLSCQSTLEYMHEICQIMPWYRLLDVIFPPLRNHTMTYSETPRLRRLISPCENLIIATVVRLNMIVATLWYLIMKHYFGLILTHIIPENHHCGGESQWSNDWFIHTHDDHQHVVHSDSDWTLQWVIPVVAKPSIESVSIHVDVLINMTDHLVAVGLSPFAVLTIKCFDHWLRHASDKMQARMMSWRARVHNAIFNHYTSPWFYASCFYTQNAMKDMLFMWKHANVTPTR